MAAAYAIESLGLSERRACLLTGISPSVYRYKSKQGDDAALRRRMRELACWVSAVLDSSGSERLG